MTTESPPPHRNLVLCFDDNVLTWQDFLLTNLHNMTRVLRTATEGRRKQVIWHHKGPLAKDVGKKTQKLPTDTQEDLQVKRKARLNTVPEPGIVWFVLLLSPPSVRLIDTGIRRTRLSKDTSGSLKTTSELSDCLHQADE